MSPPTNGTARISSYLAAILAAIGIVGAVFAAGGSWASVQHMRDDLKDTQARVRAVEQTETAMASDIREIKTLLSEMRRVKGDQ